MLGRFIYFLLIGWWLGGLIALVGLFLCATIILLPFGLILLNRLPTFIWLKEPGEGCEIHPRERHYQEELPILLRALWFFLIGWELGTLVVGVGYILCLTLIGLPIGIWLLNRVPKALTLSLHYG